MIMDPKDEQIDEVNREIIGVSGTSENQENHQQQHDNHQQSSGEPQPQQFILCDEQTRCQQQHPLDHMNQGLLSNTDFLSSLMGNGTASSILGGRQQQSIGLTRILGNIPGATNSTSMTVVAPSPQIMGINPAIDPSMVMQQHVDSSKMRQHQQDIFALIEAQRRNVNAFNPALLHQFQQSQHQQHQMDSSLAAQNQMLVDQQHQGKSFLQHYDPLMLGTMLHQARGVGAHMPMEAQPLFSTQMASQMMTGTNPLMSATPYYQRRFSIDLGEELKLAGNKGTIEPFPEKLHRLLIETQKAGLESIISFTADGTAFEIHKPDRFFKEIVPKYFKQSRLSSFKRQLNLYGFDLIVTGPIRGGYSHEKFLKDKPELCRQIRRRDIKFNSSSRPKGNKLEMNAPNFYDMPPIKASVNEKESSPRAPDAGAAIEGGTPTNTK